MCSEHVSSHGGALLLPVTTGRVQPDDRACQPTTHGQVYTGNHRGEKGREEGRGGGGEGGKEGGKEGGRE